MKTKVLSIIYFITGIVFIVLEYKSSFIPGLVIKVLIIPVLVMLFLTNLRPITNLNHRLMLAGLFFSWAGDLILEFSLRNEQLFIIGLISFLLAHVMYLIVFFKTPGKNIIFGHRIYLLIPVILYGTGLIYYLYDNLADMRLPVILYAIVILTMLTGAINRMEKVNKTSYYLVLTGAILFVFSDSVIAINKFSNPFHSARMIIMLTYVAAQFLIVLGYINQYREKFQ